LPRLFGHGYYQRYAGDVGQPDSSRMTATWVQTGIVGLRDRGLRELPDGVADVGPGAKVLDASNNQLGEWPAALGSLTELQRLLLANNAILALPGGALSPLVELRVLVLDGNMLSSLPELDQLQKLEKLSVRQNRLEVLCPSVGRLRSLQFLLLSRNRLSSLPTELGGCEALEELDASTNCITNIPASLGKLQKLKSLNLDSNQVSKVPSEILLTCVALQTLSLHANPIVPESVQETEGFKEFEQRRQAKYNKALAGGVLLGPRGMDEGIDHNV